MGCAKADNDGDGFAHGISGWDFYDHQNDPATSDGAYGHSDTQMLQAAAEGNNGLGGVGVCPGCQIPPIKAGAEALDRTDDLAQAWLYACHVGAKVIVSVTADLGYSSYMDQAINYCWQRGVVMVEASNDFDSTDHQGGMFHPYVIPGNGMVANTYTALAPPGQASLLLNQRATTTYTNAPTRRPGAPTTCSLPPPAAAPHRNRRRRWAARRAPACPGVRKPRTNT